MKIKQLLLIIGLLFTFSSSLFADNIGFVEIERVFRDAKIVKNFQDNIAQKEEKFNELLEKNNKKIEKAKEKGKSNEEIQEMITEMEEELQPLQQEVMQLQAGFQQQLLFEVTNAAKEAADEFAIDVVLEKQFVLYGGFDLTDQVIKKLNE